MKLVDITLNSTPTAPKTCKYKVEIKLNNTWFLAHTGKFWVNTGQTTIQLDLDDILVNQTSYKQHLQRLYAFSG